MANANCSSTAKVKRLHRNKYYWMCAEELAKRDGIVLDALPDNCPFWAECYKMTEEIYGLEGEGSDGNYIWPCCAKASRIAADPTLTHAQKVPLIEALKVEWERRYQVREAKREAAKTPEQRAREKENHDALDRFFAPMMEAAMAVVEESGLMADLDAYAETLPLKAGIVDIAERPFDEHLTDAGRISAKGLGIRLD